MTSTPVTQNRRHYYTQAPDGSPLDYELQATCRLVDDGNTPDIYTDLIVKTTRLWLYIATQIQAGVKVLPESIAFKSVEQSINEARKDPAKGGDLDLFPPTNEARVTVFDWNHVLHFTLHSDDAPQLALDLFWAMHDAQLELLKAFPLGTPQQSTEKAQNTASTPPQGTNTPPTSANPVEGVIVGQRCPMKNQINWAHGQQVSFTIDKIVATARQGSAAFELWGPLGQRYPIHTEFRTDKQGQVKRDFEKMLPVLNAINLSIEKPEAKGNWRLVLQANHVEKDGKTIEYMNLLSLSPI